MMLVICVARYAEAERMLSGNILTKPKSCEEIEVEFGTMACHVFSLLGQVYRYVSPEGI